VEGGGGEVGSGEGDGSKNVCTYEQFNFIKKKDTFERN
jgi:hypothetical protein